MGLTRLTTVPSLRFDSDPGRLSCDGQQVALRPKSLAVLRYLMAHPGRVIGKAELLAACWPEVCVSPAALKVCIREIGAALGDDVATPRFIEAIPRQGYRFIAPLSTNPAPVSSSKVQDKPQFPSRIPQFEAEECFHQAIAIARRQSAKSFELRAVMSLSRLWQQQGKKDEAWRMLAEIYDWFTEGFETVDLKEAKALLDELLSS